MANEDIHSFSFNLPSSIGSKTWIHIVFPEDYEFWDLHFEGYVLGIEEHGSSIWHAMSIETYQYSETNKEVKTQADCDAIITDNPTKDEKIKMMFNLTALRIIRFVLPPDTFHLVSSCDTSKGI